MTVDERWQTGNRPRCHAWPTALLCEWLRQSERAWRHDDCVIITPPNFCPSSLGYRGADTAQTTTTALSAESECNGISQVLWSVDTSARPLIFVVVRCRCWKRWQGGGGRGASAVLWNNEWTLCQSFYNVRNYRVDAFTRYTEMAAVLFYYVLSNQRSGINECKPIMSTCSHPDWVDTVEPHQHALSINR